MCGIFCEILADTPTDTPTALDSVPKLRSLLDRRGPDAQAEYERVFEDEEGKRWRAHFYASVLWLQGSSVSRQPMTNDLGDVLLWNGDVFASEDTDVINVEAGRSDTEVVFQALVKAAQSSTHKSDLSLESAVFRVLSAIRGPFALVFYCAAANKLFVGRDNLGRHSLLVSVRSDGFVISSVGAEGLVPCKELPAGGVYVADLNAVFKGKFVSLMPYRTSSHRALEEDPFGAFLTVNEAAFSSVIRTRDLRDDYETAPEAQTEANQQETASKLFDLSAIDVSDSFKVLEAYLSFDEANDNNVKRLLIALTESVRTRVETMPKLCKECVRKAVNTNGTTNGIPETSDICGISDYIRYLNIPESKDTDSALKPTNSDSAGSDPTRASRSSDSSKGVNSNSSCGISDSLRSLDIPASKDTSVKPKILESTGRDPTGSLISNDTCSEPTSCRKATTSCGHCKLAVLFSGGLDSSVLAVLCDRVLPASETVDLLNVAFEMADGSYSVPDRITAESTFRELKELCPGRVFNLVKVDVSRSSLTFWRREHVSQLLYPLRSVLDDSIGCALWFAANAKSTARVMLHGLGADEQLGGYSRHRVRFGQGGREALSAELSMEMGRIADRNLGRDNRMVADHGVAPRFPFLDEQVVSFLADTDVCAKADFRLPRGTGEKILLRALAFDLGLRRAAVEPKRAIQFGSRIAKMENRREKANDHAVRD